MQNKLHERLVVFAGKMARIPGGGDFKLKVTFKEPGEEPRILDFYVPGQKLGKALAAATQFVVSVRKIAFVSLSLDQGA